MPYLKLIIPNLGSATAREAFFSSLTESSSDASSGVIFPSTSDEISSRAIVALSNFLNCFSLSLNPHVSIDGLLLLFLVILTNLMYPLRFQTLFPNHRAGEVFCP
jgi:hypothetical protein